LRPADVRHQQRRVRTHQWRLRGLQLHRATLGPRVLSTPPYKTSLVEGVPHVAIWRAAVGNNVEMRVKDTSRATQDPQFALRCEPRRALRVRGPTFSLRESGSLETDTESKLDWLVF